MADSTIGKIVIKPVFDGKGVFAGLKKFDKQLRGLNKPIKQLNGSFNGLFKVAGIAGLTAMTLNAAKLGREMGLISRKTGIAVDRISSMQNAFAASGGDAKEVSRTLDRITTGLARISLGDASFTSSLASMNISAWDANGQLKNAEQIRLEWADWIKKQLDAGRSLASVATFMESSFGVSQAEVEELSVGSAELLKIQEKYNKKIGILGKEEAKALNEINKSVATLRTTVGVTYDKLIAESAPLLQTVLNGVQEVAKFFQDHKDLFGPLLTGLAGLSVALKALPILFTAISAHPLVAVALASMGAGYALGGGFNEPKNIKEIVKESVYKGIISQKEANIALEKLGIYKKTEGGWDDTTTGRSILDLSVPVVLGDIPEDIDEAKAMASLATAESEYFNRGVNIEQNMTINANGDVPAKDIGEAVKEGGKEIIYYIPAGNGQMQPAM